MSNEEFARTIPVNPPTVKRNKNPNTQSIGASSLTGVPCIVASHEKILIPVGTAIIIVADVK
jgi:hypothetical protein